MEKKTASKHNTIKADLSLLLSSLKTQMNCPDFQKKVLHTIYSICEKKEDHVQILRELGGVDFVYDLSKSSVVHSDVRSAAIFTLSTLAEANVSCKNSLCTTELFAEITDLLTQKDTPLVQKRVSVYLLLMLIANNKSGQTLALTTGCLDTILHLYRTTFVFAKGLDFQPTSHVYELWIVLGNVLCSCVNNPQNVEAQNICVAIFPNLKTWLQQMSSPSPEIFQSLCSLISMIVSNNSHAQECISAVGLLEALTITLIHQSSSADSDVLSCQLSKIATSTLSTCITNKSGLASSLAKYHIIANLLILLMSPYLDHNERLLVLLTIGLCTESSTEHQIQLVEYGGLPLIITFLAEETNVEIKKVSTCILKTCWKAFIQYRDQKETKEDLPNIQTDEESIYSNSTKDRVNVSKFSPFLLPTQNQKDINVNTKKTNEKTKINCFLNPWESTQNFRGNETCSGYMESDSVSSPVQSLERGSESHSTNKQMLERRLSLQQTKPKESNCTNGLWDHEKKTMENNMAVRESLSHTRCSGCFLSFEEVTSRNFDSLQNSCQTPCDMHKALQQATEQFRGKYLTESKRLGKSEMSNARVSAQESNLNNDRSDTSLPQLLWRKRNASGLIPARKKFVLPNGISLTPLKKLNSVEVRTGHQSGERRGKINSGCNAGSMRSPALGSNRRKRQEFSSNEIQYLLAGVQKFGFSWNTILWSYPFHCARTNVDLAMKYRRLMRRETLL